MTIRQLAAVMMATAALGTLAGCRIETEDLFRGAEQTRSLQWSSGETINIENDNGDIEVIAGSDSSHVILHAKPFTRAKDDAEARDKLNSELALVASDSGEVVIHGDKTGGVTSGWDLVVEMPPGFDAAFNLTSHNGTVDVLGLGNVQSADLVQDNGTVIADLGNAVINVSSKNADVTLQVGGGGSGTVHTGNGTIELEIPTAANATLQAVARDGGSVTVSPSLPASWAESTNGNSAKSYTCNAGGGGRLYSLSAGGTSLANVVIFPR